MAGGRIIRGLSGEERDAPTRGAAWLLVPVSLVLLLISRVAALVIAVLAALAQSSSIASWGISIVWPEQRGAGRTCA